MSSEYEPLERLSLRALTKKTLFLVALATAKRVGELQALSRQVSFQGKDLFFHIYHILLRRPIGRMILCLGLFVFVLWVILPGTSRRAPCYTPFELWVFI